MPFAGHWFALLLVFLFWIGVIALVAWVVRLVWSSNGRDHGIRILQERFARGEIDQQEFERGKPSCGAN